ncbi:MAG: hypothetical protein LBP65_01350 [Puniceicoccales bacterium]|jgi:hypothetical protein|nr:hypothetical protein [Puniceicoccales bacterium]
MKPGKQGWKVGGFALFEILLLMVFLMLLSSWGMRRTSRECQRQETVRALRSFLQEAVELAELGPHLLLVGNRTGAAEWRELLLAEWREGQLAILANSHLQLPAGATVAAADGKCFEMVCQNEALPDPGDLPGRWTALQLLQENFCLILHFPDAPPRHFIIGENGTIFEKTR